VNGSAVVRGRTQANDLRTEGGRTLVAITRLVGQRDADCHCDFSFLLSGTGEESLISKKRTEMASPMWLSVCCSQSRYSCRPMFMICEARAKSRRLVRTPMRRSASTV